jgi:hypothetical protein
MEKSSATPVLGSLLTEGPIRMITQGIELSAEYDEKCISEVPIKDMQVIVNMNSPLLLFTKSLSSLNVHVSNFI